MSFDDWYTHYPKKVGKGAAIKAWDKLKPDAELEKKMILALDAQKRYRKEAKQAGEFVPDWCGPAVWLNQMRWLDEIGSHAELKENIEAKFCECGKPVHGPKFDKCTNCFAERVRTVPGSYGYYTSQRLKRWWSEHPELHGIAGREMVKAFVKGIRR